MADDNAVQRILQFVKQLKEKANPSEAELMQEAVSRNWLKSNGEITSDGQTLVRSLTEQQNTRTTLRNLL